MWYFRLYIYETMSFDNLTTAELQDLLVEETKKLTQALRYGTREEYEALRMLVNEIIKAIEERKNP